MHLRPSHTVAGGQAHDPVPQVWLRPQGGRHFPLRQRFPGAQLNAQFPQNFGSLFTSWQTPLQHRKFTPGPVGQGLPQLPQLALLISGFTHSPLQQTSPPSSPVRQWRPQLPQNRGDSVRLTQIGVPSKSQVVGLSSGQWQAAWWKMQTPEMGQGTHWPEQHVLSPHGLPHAPQLEWSLLVSTHVPPQSV
jgi:hypothetical protein